MKRLIKLFALFLFSFIFSGSVYAHNYENTIDHMLFGGYKENGISVSVTTNFDTEEGAKIYLAVYNNAGVLCEVVSKPLEQKDEGESKIYRLKITSVLDNTMTVKAFIWKDMMPCAEVFSKLYNDKYDSVPVPTVPDYEGDYKIELPEKEETDISDIIDGILDDSNTIPGIGDIDYPIVNPGDIIIERIDDEVIIDIPIGKIPNGDFIIVN